MRPAASMGRVRVLVTGGAGYVGALVVEGLLGSGHDVRVLDALRFGQRAVADALVQQGAELVESDLREAAARRRALRDVSAVVHLAAIVGDPACARRPDEAHAVNIEATRELIDEACAVGVERFVFASTCSNYGRMADPTVPIDEHGVLAPISLYAEQKVAIERALLELPVDRMAATCLRFATVYGVGPRMRFDLVVNEFTRDLWSGCELEVFGETFWRPYIHVRDAARAVRAVLNAPAATVAGEVFNVGSSTENYRKLDIVEMIRRQIDRGSVRYVHRDEDPRDYKVSFEKFRDRLGFAPEMVVPDGIAEVIQALDAHSFDDPFAACYVNAATLLAAEEGALDGRRPAVG